MIELVLVRHAKSDWSAPRISDHDRPLNARGRRDAPVMAERLARAAPRPDRLISSTALRARSTAEYFGAALGVDVELDPELYLASDAALFGVAAAAGTDRVLLVSHDPGISDLAHRLSDGGITRMPTCAIARFEWTAATWADAGIGAADHWAFDTPRGGSASGETARDECAVRRLD